MVIGRFGRIADGGGPRRGEQHEQVDVELEPSERRPRAPGRVPPAADGRREEDRPCRGGIHVPLDHGAGHEQHEAQAGEHRHGAALRALHLFGVREPCAPGFVRERAHHFDAVVGLLVARQRDAATCGAGAELGGGRGVELPEPQGARCARIQSFPLVARGDTLGEHRADIIRERIQVVRRDERRLVAHGERAVLEVGLDRHDARPLAQPVGEDLEAAFTVGGHREVLDRLRRRLKVGTAAGTVVEAAGHARPRGRSGLPGGCRRPVRPPPSAAWFISARGSWP
jgi:hypothetical protein